MKNAKVKASVGPYLWPNSMVEANVPTMILFCVKSAEMLLIYINGRRFGPVAFISARLCM